MSHITCDAIANIAFWFVGSAPSLMPISMSTMKTGNVANRRFTTPIAAATNDGRDPNTVGSVCGYILHCANQVLVSCVIYCKLLRRSKQCAAYKDR